jgi:zinc/manganese transport system permease protein
MLGAAGVGIAATVLGLLVSWHWGTAAGATIAASAVALFFVSAAAAHVRGRLSVDALRGEGKVAR